MKKFLSILLTVAMVLSMLCLPAVAAETDDDGYTLVSTFEELLAIKTADQKARLTKDIKVPTNYGTKIVDGVLNLTGQAGILQPGTFRAEWDGNGYEIDFSDITIKFTHSTRTVEEEEKDNDGAAVFFTTFVGKWKNITLTGLNIEANDNTVASCQAGIVSYKGPNGGASAENGFFENVRIEAEFTNSKMTKSMNFGSYIGLLDAAQSGAISFLNCSSDLTVNSEKGIGASGFVGAARSTKAGTLSFTNCTTSGNINTGAGRAAGFLLEAKDDQIVTFTNCVNAANITGGVVGGIMAAGAVTSGKTYTPTRTFKNCVNVGDLTGSSSTAGILANNPGSTQAKYTIDGCVNAGDITSSAQRAAGIVAHFASGTLDVDNCINFGDVDNSAEAATVAGHSTPQVFQAATIVCYIRIITVETSHQRCFTTTRVTDNSNDRVARNVKLIITGKLFFAGRIGNDYIVQNDVILFSDFGGIHDSKDRIQAFSRNFSQHFSLNYRRGCLVHKTIHFINRLNQLLEQQTHSNDRARQHSSRRNHHNRDKQDDNLKSNLAGLLNRIERPHIAVMFFLGRTDSYNGGLETMLFVLTCIHTTNKFQVGDGLANLSIKCILLCNNIFPDSILGFDLKHGNQNG